MALDFTLVLRAEAASAKAEVAGTTQEIKGLTAATEQSTVKSKAAAGAADSEAAAKRRNAQASREMATANRQAAGATGDLIAQFNDIGMMMAAGQNPLQLAIQQGSQITQRLGPMGAAGAAKALGSAFVGMLNPINLIIPAVIAAAGYMIQWLTSADDDAAAVTEELERQKAALQGVIDETERLRLARGMQMSGAESPDEQIVLEQINRLTAERAAVQERLNSLKEIGSRAAGYAGQVQAEREVLSAEIALLDAKIAALQKQRELNEATKNGAAIAEQLKTSTLAVTSAMKSADGSQLVAAFAAAFPTARALFGITQGIVSMLGSFDYGSLGNDERGTQRGELRSAGEFRSRQAVAARIAGMGKAAGSGAGGGGGGAAARDEADALQELIASLEGEIEALHVQDPIQQEMLKHREALAGATEAERLKVEELIRTREREQMLMEGAKARAQFFEDIGTSALESLIVKGESFNDVLKNIAKSLIDAALQAAIFGKGPFGSLFGGKSILSGLFGGGGGGMGGLGSLLGGGDLFGGLASGGMVHGPGTGTSDSIPTMLSNGEFVVNARATARNRHMLEAINSGGRIAGYAEGGFVGSDNRRMSGRRAGRDLPAQIYMDFRGVKGDREIEAMAHQAAAKVVAMYDREGLPVSIQRVSSDAKRRG